MPSVYRSPGGAHADALAGLSLVFAARMLRKSPGFAAVSVLTLAVWAYGVSGYYFDALGIQRYLGRLFHGSDEHGPNNAPYIVLTYSCWHRRFNHWCRRGSFLAEKHDRSDGEGALTGNPRGEQADEGHRQHDASKHERVSRSGFVNDGGQDA